MPTARNSLTTSNKTAAVTEKKGKTIIFQNFSSL